MWSFAALWLMLAAVIAAVIATGGSSIPRALRATLVLGGALVYLVATVLLTLLAVC